MTLRFWIYLRILLLKILFSRFGIVSIITLIHYFKFHQYTHYCLTTITVDMIWKTNLDFTGVGIFKSMDAINFNFKFGDTQVLQDT